MVWYPAASGWIGMEKGRAKGLEPVGVECEQLSLGVESNGGTQGNTEVLAHTDLWLGDPHSTRSASSPQSGIALSELF